MPANSGHDATVERLATTTPEQTEAVGARLAAELRPGELVLVHGELGAGKTTLVRGAARALGVDGAVTSPTFSIGHRYRGRGVVVAHLDLYRLRSLADEEDPDLLSDYLGPDTIAFVEWPGAAGSELADEASVTVSIQHAGGDRRELEIRRPRRSGSP